MAGVLTGHYALLILVGGITTMEERESCLHSRNIRSVITKFVLMLFSAKTRSVLFVLFAMVFILAAIYHLVLTVYKVDDTPVWRHLLFVVIDLFCAYGSLKRSKYFLYFIAPLLIQQYYSHGTYLINMWNEKRQIHWISVFDLLLFPIGLICLIEDYKMKHK